MTAKLSELHDIANRTLFFLEQMTNANEFTDIFESATYLPLAYKESKGFVAGAKK